jgi:hypothetical protein
MKGDIPIMNQIISVKAIEHIQTFPISIKTDSEVHNLVLSKVNNGEHWEVLYEVDGCPMGTELYFNSETEARNHIKSELK